MKDWRVLIGCVTLLLGGIFCNARPAPPTAPAGNTTQPGVLVPTVPASAPTAMAPAPNPAYPLISVNLEAVQVSDDDGSRTSKITTEQIKQWVDKANEIFAKASVRFIYDPSSDLATLKSTLLNDMSGDTDTNWNREVEQGNRVAAHYAGKAVLFFINGAGNAPTGGGFSSVDYNFVELPGFATSVCGNQNIGLLAHEVGHYFGLSHPFVKTFASLKEAESYLTANGNKPDAFDGDGLSDTPPDPFIATPKYQCNPQPSIALNGQSFPLPIQNIMSYYYNAGVDRTELTPQQSDIVRWIAGLRSKNGMATPTNLGIPGAIDFTTLAIKDKAGIDASVQDMSTFGDAPRWIGNKQLFCSTQSNGRIGFTISVSAAGHYSLDLYATTAPDFGKIQPLIDGKPLGSPIDLYGPLVLPTGRMPLGAIDLSAGTHTLSFRVAGKNAASGGSSFGLNAFTLTAGQ